MIFGFSHYGLGKRRSRSEPSQPRDSETEVVAAWQIEAARW